MNTIITCKQYFFVFILLYLISGCSPSSHNLALQEYKQAANKGKIEEVIKSLNKLVKIDEKKYINKLITAQTVKKQLKTIEDELINKEYFAAYLTSHEAYRSLPILQCKKLLVVTGNKLIPLLKVQNKIQKSFHLTPKLINSHLKEYINKPVSKWNLISINQFIGKLNSNSQLLQGAIDILNKMNFKNHELIKLMSDIEQRLLLINRSKSAVINLAISNSASVLVDLNTMLIEKSANMYSLLRPSLAEKNLQSIFLKAKTTYEPYRTLIENISFADSNHKVDKHAHWYKNWHEIELAVFTINKNSLLSSKILVNRHKRLNYYKNKHDSLKYLSNFKYQNINEFMLQHKELKRIVNKLMIDKNVINYGLPTNLLSH